MLVEINFRITDSSRGFVALLLCLSAVYCAPSGSQLGDDGIHTSGLMAGDSQESLDLPPSELLLFSNDELADDANSSNPAKDSSDGLATLKRSVEDSIRSAIVLSRRQAFQLEAALAISDFYRRFSANADANAEILEFLDKVAFHLLKNSHNIETKKISLVIDSFSYKLDLRLWNLLANWLSVLRKFGFKSRQASLDSLNPLTSINLKQTLKAEVPLSSNSAMSDEELLAHVGIVCTNVFINDASELETLDAPHKHLNKLTYLNKTLFERVASWQRVADINYLRAYYNLAIICENFYKHTSNGHASPVNKRQSDLY